MLLRACLTFNPTYKDFRLQSVRHIYNTLFHFTLLTKEVIISAAAIWLKYCRYGLKHYPINQSINHFNLFDSILMLRPMTGAIVLNGLSAIANSRQ